MTDQGEETTYFVGTYYEIKGEAITKYYYAGGQRIAMRADGNLAFLLGDHLGSTSLTTDAAGNVLAEQRYTAWGEVRFDSGDLLTSYTYTGQYSYTADFGLMYYNARWYDANLGRFAQADTIVPISRQGVQAFDRYAYVNNNPMKYTDPTGHDAWWCSPQPNCQARATGAWGIGQAAKAGNAWSQGILRAAVNPIVSDPKQRTPQPVLVQPQKPASQPQRPQTTVAPVLADPKERNLAPQSVGQNTTPNPVKGADVVGILLDIMEEKGILPKGPGAVLDFALEVDGTKNSDLSQSERYWRAIVVGAESIAVGAAVGIGLSAGCVGTGPACVFGAGAGALVAGLTAKIVLDRINEELIFPALHQLVLNYKPRMIPYYEYHRNY